MIIKRRIPVPYGCSVSVSLVREPDVTHVIVHAPLYANKEWRMPHCYRSEFTDQEILNDSDFKRVLTNHFGQTKN